MVRAYFQLLEAERLREVTEKNVTLDREQLDNAQAKFQNGRLTKNDVAEVRMFVERLPQKPNVIFARVSPAT